MDDARENVPADIVGAEEVRGRGRLQGLSTLIAKGDWPAKGRETARAARGDDQDEAEREVGLTPEPRTKPGGVPAVPGAGAGSSPSGQSHARIDDR